MKTVDIFAKILMAAALLLAPSARALILTSWELPTNTKALESEYAANTNVVTVLKFSRSDNDGSATMLFRNSDGKLAAMSVGEDEFLARFSLVKSRGGAVRTAAAADIQASDESANYANEETWLGKNGGEGGWGSPWKQMPGSGEVTAADAGFEDGYGGRDMSLWPQRDSGVVAVGRQLPAPLESGEFSIRAWIDTSVVDGDFRGFALYDEQGEVLRVGASSEGGIIGYYYAARNGENGLFFQGGLSTDLNTGLKYTLTWERLGNEMQFSWADQEGYWGDEREEGYVHAPSVSVNGVTAIDAIAVLTTGRDSSDPWYNPQIVFREVTVSGRAVPEPGTLALLAAGTALLAWRRRSRRA